MSENLQSAMTNDDLRAMRALAEEGRNKPMLGGRYLVTWGLLTSIGLLFTGLVAMRVFAISGWWTTAFWMVIGAIGSGLTVYFSKRDAVREETISLAQKIESIVWSIGGFFFFVVFAGILVLYVLDPNRFGGNHQSFGLMFAMIPSMAFGIYAVALAASAVAAKAKWMWKFVIISMVFVLLSTVTVMTILNVFVTILGVMLVVTTPGFVMLQKEKAKSR